MTSDSKTTVDTSIPASLKVALDKVVLDSMRIMSVGMAAVLSFFLIIGFAELLKPVVFSEIVIDGVLLLVTLIGITALHKKIVPERFASLLATCSILIIQLDLILSTYFTNSSLPLKLMPYLIIAAGTLLLSVRWLLGAILIVIATGLPAVLLMSSGMEQTEIVVHHIPAGALCFAVFAARRQSHRRIYQFRCEDAASKEQLSRALKDVEKSFIEYMRAEEDKHQMEDHLRQVQKLEAVGVLAGGIAHGMNNLLGGISAYASLVLEDTPETDPRRQDIKEILSASQRGGELTRNLLGFARKGRFQFEAVDINQSVRQVVRMLQSTLKKNIDISCRLDDRAGNVMADAGQLNQVIMNLCINAAHAMQDGGELHILTIVKEIGQLASPLAGLQPGKYVHLSVRDTGCGMSKQTLERAFEPFFTTKRQDEGTGLGLAMVYGTLQSHGGAVFIDSEPGKGTEVSAYFPTAKPPVHKPALPNIPEPSAIESQAAHYQSVLVVDDEPLIRASAKRILSRIGCEVFLAENGIEAVEQYKKNQDRIQLVILDIAMPIMDGPECFRRLRAINPQLPVVISTGYSDETQTDPLLLSGAVGLLPKPYDLTKMAALIKRPIARKE